MFPEYEIKLYNDGGLSGSTLDRPELTNLLEDIEIGKIQIFMFTDLDRITRGGVAHTEYILTHAQKHNCEVVCLYQNVNISDPDEEFNTYLNSLLAKREVKKVSIRTKRGIAGGLKNGIYTLGGILPLGYKREKDKSITIVESEAAIVKDIFSYVNSKTPLFIIEQKIKDRYNVNIKDFRIKKIINNRKYTGVVHYMDLEYHNIIPSMISETIFEQAQISYKNCIGYTNKKNIYNFTNKLQCKNCNSSMLNRSGYKKNKKYFYLYCQKCNRWINQDKVTILLEQEILEAYAKFKLAQNKNNFKTEIDAANKKIGQLNQRLKNLQIAFLDSVIDKNDFIKHEHEIRKQLKYYKNFLLENRGTIEAFHLINPKKQRLIIEQYLKNQFI
jgi:Site-specific recombinases, DNA invertase Pin homologs